MTRADRTLKIPQWAHHYSLYETIDTLPMKEVDVDVVLIEFIERDFPDPYGRRCHQPLSWWWRKLSEESRTILQAAYEKDHKYRTELAVREGTR